MPQEKITIKFVPDGHKDLIAAINKLNTSTKKLTGATNETVVASGKATKASTLLQAGHHRLAATNGKLAMSFATLRSKMLLVTFAMSMGGRQAIQMVKDFAKVEAMSVAFDTLSGGAGNASIALSQLSNAVGGTMSRMDLLQTANNALILGVAKSSKEMSVMFGVAVKLGRAVGRTAKDSVDSLVTGIGRQSRLMLDNIGIIMDTEKAYAAYASELGVTVESLNETERRQAFLNATLEAAKEKADLLGDSIETLQSKAERAGSSWDNLQVAAGGFISTMFDVDTGLDKTADVFDILTFAMDENLKIAKTWGSGMVKTFKTMLNSIPAVQALGIIIGEVTDRYKEQADAVTLLGGDEDILFKVKQASGEQEIKMRKLVSETTNAKLRSLDALIDEVKEGKRFFLTTKDQLDVLAMLEKQYKDLDPAEKERIENLKALNKQTKENEGAMKQSEREYMRALRAVEALFPSEKQHFEQTLEQIESEEHMQEVLAKTIAKLDKLGIAHDLETDAMRANREEAEEYNDAFQAALAIWEERVEQAKAYKIALEGLKIVEMERDALMDGSISLAEEYAILLEKQRQAQEALDEALNQDDIVAQADAQERLNNLTEDFIKLTEIEITNLKIIRDEFKQIADGIEKIELPEMEFIDTGGITKLEEFLGMSLTVFEEVSTAAIDNASVASGAFSAMTSAMSTQINARMKADMDALKETSKYKLALERGDTDAVKKMEKDVTDSYAEERTRLAKFEKASNLAQAGINIATAITKALPNVILASLVAAMGAVQIATIASTPIPKFQTGGMIGGRRHSQGGTMIEAEAGEFVMSRSAVDSVGIENLNRMNEGGGGGSVTVNVSGNVLSQDFVEGELAENIKEAIRRGTDFGIG